jgi:hypothetical protein
MEAHYPALGHYRSVKWRQVKHSAEYNAFTNAVERIMSIPKAEILRREAEYKKQADLNPRKRGPKPGALKKVARKIEPEK